MPDSRYEHVIIATWNLHGLLFIIPDVDTLYIQHGLLFILILPISVCILGTCSLLTGFSKKRRELSGRRRCFGCRELAALPHGHNE